MASGANSGKGKDNFKNYTFYESDWSAPVMDSPQEIRDRLDSFALCGRRIKRMRMIGLSYYHTRDWIEEAAYRQSEHLPEELRRIKSAYQSIEPAAHFFRYAQIDEPLLIEFEDGDVFEIETPWEPKFRMSLNCIPWRIKAGINQPNIEADILFSPCIGQEVIAVEINTCMADKGPMAIRDWGERVSDVTLRLKNGAGLQISPDITYCEVACVDAHGEWLKINFSELKEALFNWEDLHNDEVSGFEAESATLFFGSKGAKYTEEPYMTLSSSSRRDSLLNIYVGDFLVLDWSISLLIGTGFDEYGKYHFNRRLWYGILDEAERFLSVESFDALFDEFAERQGSGNYMVQKLNSGGAVFWKERGKYRVQLKDIREWSDMVLRPGDNMDIYGF